MKTLLCTIGLITILTACTNSDGDALSCETDACGQPSQPLQNNTPNTHEIGSQKPTQSQTSLEAVHHSIISIFK
ncbi:hypothetical protein [Glaesserella sp.]|uniref:hypothetical protein n=1 Tax=Glaesserella sp. TaxID=2094731 RepID=UPI00359F3C39